MRMRRRRKDWTPAQVEARKKLHRAEMWSMIVGDGIAEAFKRERYCGDGLRTIIDFVNTEFLAAVTGLENANAEVDAAFERTRAKAAVVVARKHRVPKKKAAKK